MGLLANGYESLRTFRVLDVAELKIMVYCEVNTHDVHSTALTNIWYFVSVHILDLFANEEMSALH